MNIPLVPFFRFSWYSVQSMALSPPVNSTWVSEMTFATMSVGELVSAQHS
jgi:hypothetical protein